MVSPPPHSSTWGSSSYACGSNDNIKVKILLWGNDSYKIKRKNNTPEIVQFEKSGATFNLSLNQSGWCHLVVPVSKVMVPESSHHHRSHLEYLGRLLDISMCIYISKLWFIQVNISFQTVQYTVLLLYYLPWTNNFCR